jgi:hypothetical protein
MFHSYEVLQLQFVPNAMLHFHIAKTMTTKLDFNESLPLMVKITLSQL